MPKSNPRIIVFSGPSGCGKTTLISSLQKLTGGITCISTTTRPIRPGEKHEVDYHFLSESEFEHHKETGSFLEYMTFNGYQYGTRKYDLEHTIAQSKNRDIYLDMSCTGADAICDIFSQTIKVFVLPPSYQEARSRLKKRGMSELEIENRFTEDDSPIIRAVDYEFIIVNHTDRLDATVGLLYQLLQY